MAWERGTCNRESAVDYLAVHENFTRQATTRQNSR
jgi:hypothetical protein